VEGYVIVTITEFLTARLNEDEALAREMPAGPWVHVHVEDLAPNGHQVMGQPEDPKDPDSAPWIAAADDDALLAEYIATFHPARVLADVAAKRAIVALHPCDDCGTGDDPCLTLRLIAQPYLGHSDFDQARWGLR
jgi:hypothetical protein